MQGKRAEYESISRPNPMYQPRVVNTAPPNPHRTFTTRAITYMVGGTMSAFAIGFLFGGGKWGAGHKYARDPYGDRNRPFQVLDPADDDIALNNEEEGMSGPFRKRGGWRGKNANKDADIVPASVYELDQGCTDGSYSTTTLKTALETPFHSLFQDNRGLKKHEASAVTVVGDYMYAVCDNSWSISKIHRSLPTFSSQNVLIGDPYRDPKEDSGYEAIFHDSGTFYVMRESVEMLGEVVDGAGGDDVAPTSYHAVIEELSLDSDDDYTVLSQCASEFEFEGTSKGFEGAVGIRDINDELVILALCEGNYCSEKYKGKRGHGRVIAMKKRLASDSPDGDDCLWETVAKLKLPKTAYFMDYSDMDISDSGKVIITSQEDSALWTGQLLGLDERGRLDLDKAGFDKTEGGVSYFPKSADCETVYCNIEGIHFLSDEMVVGVSDKMKKGGKQDFRCFDKDQSVHVFVLP